MLQLHGCNHEHLPTVGQALLQANEKGDKGPVGLVT